MGADVGGTSSAKSEPNVVPLCDILLVLLIIFMVVTPMIKGGVNVKLPDARNTANLPEPGQLFTVYVKGNRTNYQIYFDSDTPILNNDISKLPMLIKDKLEDSTSEEKKKRILIKADDEISFGVLADVLNAIREAQIELVGLVTEQKTTSGE